MEIMVVVGIGVFLMVAWTLGGWAIVRMGFTRDRDAVPDRDDDAPAAPVRPDHDPDAAWRAQMKAATAASGARCTCPAVPGQSSDPAAARPDGVVPDPDCPIHRWDFA